MSRYEETASSSSTCPDPVLDDRVIAILTRLEDDDARESVDDVPWERRSLACGPETGRMLFALVAANRGCRVLEIGGSRGYSTIWLAAAARIAGGTVISIDRDPEKIAAWNANLDDAGLRSYATLVEGDALEALSRQEGRFDVVFLDAWKDDYELFFTAARSLVEPGGVVAADNVGSHEALAGYVARRQADPTLSSVTLPIGSGVELTTVLRP